MSQDGSEGSDGDKRGISLEGVESYSIPMRRECRQLGGVGAFETGSRFDPPCGVISLNAYTRTSAYHLLSVYFMIAPLTG